MSLITIRDPSAFRAELQHSDADKAAFDPNTGEKMGEKQGEKLLSRHYYNHNYFKTKKQRSKKRWRFESEEDMTLSILFPVLKRTDY